MSLVESPPSWIVTLTGIQFDFLRPTTDMINASDIAVALSRTCRFAGHTERWYTVAEHCYHCSYLVPPEDALAALLHDAAEAYIGDITSPLKSHIPYAKVIEKKIQSVIAAKFRLPSLMTPTVKLADEIMLHREASELIRACNAAERLLRG